LFFAVYRVFVACCQKVKNGESVLKIEVSAKWNRRNALFNGLFSGL